MLPESPGDITEPEEVALGSNVRPVGAGEEELGAALCLVCSTCLDGVGGVKVAAVELALVLTSGRTYVGRALEELEFLLGELGETSA